MGRNPATVEIIEDDSERFQRLALAALKPLARPTEAMVDAAHAAVEFDDYWAINSRSDFRKTVRAMIRAAIEDGERPDAEDQPLFAAAFLEPLPRP